MWIWLGKADDPIIMLAKPNSWVAEGEKLMQGLRSRCSVTKRDIAFRARQIGQAWAAGVRANWSDNNHFAYSISLATNSLME